LIRRLAACFLAACIVLTAGCGTSRSPNRPGSEESRAASARVLSDTAVTVAVSKVGARVCRALKVGISERDWIRGVVIEAGSDTVRIRIDDPGRFPHTLDGTALSAGTVIQDRATNWTPCV
jgi:hypothetical protein